VAKFEDFFKHDETEQETSEPLFSQTLAEFMASHIPADYLINGLIRRGWLYGCTALGTTGKTALAELLTKLVAQDQRPAFFGPYEVEHGKVAYFAGENPDDLRERFIADLDLSPGITVPNGAVRFFPQLFNPETAFDAVEAEIKKMGGADLLIVDTSNAYFTKYGDKENDNGDTGPWARVLRSLTRLSGKPTVLGLCHPTKYVADPALLMPRGGSAFFLELDGNLTLWKDRESGLITLSQNRMRGVEFEPITLRTELIRSDKVRTAKGHIMPTIRMVVVSEQDADLLDRAAAASGNVLLLVIYQNKGLSQRDLALKCGWSKSGVNRGLLGLKERGLARKDHGQWALTKRGKEAAEEATEQKEAAAAAKKQF
jgi:hypothetical protein